MVILSILINFVIGLGIALAGKILFSYEVTSFSLFFIVPVGAFILGLIVNGGLARGLYKKNIKGTKTFVILNVVLGVLFFAAIQFGYYQVTYVDSDINVNYKFEGEHISEYSFNDSNENINFQSYFLNKINSQSITFTRRIVKEIGTVEKNKIVNWMFFFLEFLGFILGGHIAYLTKLEDKIYCDSCKKYMKDNKLIRISSDTKERYAQLEEILSNEGPESIEELKRFIEENSIAQEPSNSLYLEGVLNMCEDCNGGRLTFKGYCKNEKGKYENDKALDSELSISKRLVQSLV